MTLEELVKKAVVKIILRYPFLGAILMEYPIVFVTGEQIRVAATDGLKIYINKEMPKEYQNEDDLLFIVMHELTHILMSHITRGKQKEHNLWNIAIDLTTNFILHVDFGLKLPYGVYYDLILGKLTSEEIYEKLTKEKEDSAVKRQIQKGYNPFDNHLPPSEEDEAIEKEIESKIKSAIFKANNISSYGNLPGSLSRYISSILEPRISWRQYLINKIVYAKHGGHIVKRLQRKTIYSPYKFFRTKEAILDVVIAVDTSGSIGEDDLNAFITEIKSIAETFKVKGKLVDCDTEINNVYDLEKLDNDLVNINFTGGGGTSFLPPFKFVEENNIRPKVLIYFTDACGDFPEDAPPYEVIWLVKNSEIVPPFGEVIYYDKYND